jgi:hypothetical protein
VHPPPRDRRAFWLWPHRPHGIAVQWHQLYEAWWPTMGNIPHIGRDATMDLPYQALPSIPLSYSTSEPFPLPSFPCLSPLLSAGRTLQYFYTLPCGKHDRTKLRNPGGLLEGRHVISEGRKYKGRGKFSRRSHQLKLCVLLYCSLLPILALEVEFLVSQQCLTSFMAIRPM